MEVSGGPADPPSQREKSVPSTREAYIIGYIRSGGKAQLTTKEAILFNFSLEKYDVPLLAHQQANAKVRRIKQIGARNIPPDPSEPS